ncbi:unnamed protein product [Caenorhabditis nigoni]
MPPFLFLFVFCVVPIYADLKECTAKEQVVSQGKCARHVNDLMFLTEEFGEKEMTLAAAKNISTTCETVTSCFGGLQCAEAQRNYKTYEQKCEKINFKTFDVTECMSKWFREFYEKNLTCAGHFNYRSKDMKIRREAYTSGKSCFMDFAGHFCSDNALDYLKMNYEKVLEVLTEPSENCNALHNELMGQQCDVLFETMREKMGTLQIDSILGSKAEAYSSMATLCNDIKDCYSGLCHVNQNMTEVLDELCDTIKAKTLEPETYYSCMVKIIKSNTILDYDCVRTKNKASNVSEITMADTAVFMTDKECTRTVMEGMCDKEAVSDFDIEWEIHQKSARNQV